MITTNDKLNSIYQTKLRIKNVIQTESDEFSEYPDLIAAAISPSGGGVSYSYLNEKLTYYVEKDELYNSSYATTSYVVDYVAEHGGGGGSEVTYTYLSENYLAKSGGAMTGQLTLNNGVTLHVGTERPWDIYEGGTGENASLTIRNTVDGKHLYIKDINYNNIVDIHNNVTGTGSIKLSYNLNTYTNNIIPNENNTYSLGSSNAVFSTIWTPVLNCSSTFKIKENNSIKYEFYQSVFQPASNNSIKLGDSDKNWAATYTYSLYLNGTDIKTSINGMFSYDSSTGTLTITTLS